MRICAITHQPPGFSAHSAFPMLMEIVGARQLLYPVHWHRAQRWSWRLGQVVQRAGIRWYGSTWNALLPVVDDLRFPLAARRLTCDVAHYLFGEFARPRWPGLFGGRCAVVGTYHCSARRQASVLDGVRSFDGFHRISVVSRTQVPYFVSRGYPADRIDVTLLGVDADHFVPGAYEQRTEGPLRCLMIGFTERDNAFLAEVMRALPKEHAHLYLRAPGHEVELFKGLENVTPLPRLSDEELVRTYQTMDLVIMPFLDCTANDALLEMMACGMPVLTNRVGGISEYISAECNWVMDDKKAPEWADLVVHLSRNRGELWRRRPAVRAWAETFDWRLRAQEYLSFYRKALESLS